MRQTPLLPHCPPKWVWLLQRSAQPSRKARWGQCICWETTDCILDWGVVQAFLGTVFSWAFPRRAGRGRGRAGGGSRSPALPVLPGSHGLSFHMVLSPSSSRVACVKRALSDWIQTSQDVTGGFLVGMNMYMFAVLLWEVKCASWKALGAGNNKKGEPFCFLQWELAVSS